LLRHWVLPMILFDHGVPWCGRCQCWLGVPLVMFEWLARCCSQDWGGGRIWNLF
jgi:hypothetical protein